MFKFLNPAKHITRLPENEIPSVYNKNRIKVFIGIFVGYAGYYLVRKNFALVIPDLIQEGFTKSELGFALSGVSIAYGISKFFMGNVSDRSNSRIQMLYRYHKLKFLPGFLLICIHCFFPKP